ncbi:MAG: hypothetical protein RI904_674 [Pseudomonadota bacterium]
MIRSVDGVLSARCEAIEARMDARVVEMKGEVRALLVRMDERDSRNLKASGLTSSKPASRSRT